jgi:hypothetical protein
MQPNRMCAIALAVGLVLVGLPLASAWAQNVSVGINTPSVTFGLNIGAPPPLVAVPGLPVYQAPSVPDNYFVYQGAYYLYHGGAWHYSRHYNGPWMALQLHQVPQPILAVPVPYYKHPPAHWKKHGPPPWAVAKGYDKEHGHGKGKGHGKEAEGKGYNKERGPGQGKGKGHDG